MGQVKLAVVGSRTFNDYKFLCQEIKHFINIIDGLTKENLTIVSGGARADWLAKEFCKEYDVEYKEFPAAWDTYGKSAGYKRNIQIAEYSDACLAFWDGESKGTKHTIDLFVKMDKPYSIVWGE